MPICGINYIMPRIVFVQNYKKNTNEKVDYGLYDDKIELLNDIKNKNIRNKFKIFDQRFQDGKKSIIINYNNITEIFLIIYRNSSMDENAFFGFKYYSFSQDEYKTGKYLYKSRFNLTGTKVNLNKRNNNTYFIEWSNINLAKVKFNKAASRVDYFLKIKINDNDANKNNSGLFLNYKDKKDINVKGVHLINKNQTEVSLYRNDMKNITVYLIAKFNELNGMENFIVYQPAYIQRKQYKGTKNENNNKNDINNKGTNKKKFLKS